MSQGDNVFWFLFFFLNLAVAIDWEFYWTAAFLQPSQDEKANTRPDIC